MKVTERSKPNKPTYVPTCCRDGNCSVSTLSSPRAQQARGFSFSRMRLQLWSMAHPLGISYADWRTVEVQRGPQFL